ncbi:hypothetical protein [Streptomyces sp. NPDC057579]|uniref:hypothetical protein n=1 Tax=Streptomyces sp. NPDC057579 TaxID=3346172 RepID=UPI0036BA36B8
MRKLLFTALRRFGVSAAALSVALLPSFAGGTDPAEAQPRAAASKATQVAQAPQVVVGPVSADGKMWQALCPSGTKVLNGGYIWDTFCTHITGVVRDAIVTSAPRFNGEGWNARELQGKVQARALCVPA